MEEEKKEMIEVLDEGVDMEQMADIEWMCCAGSFMPIILW